MKVDRSEDYPADSLGAEVLRLCDEADTAWPGSGEALLAKFNAQWEAAAIKGLGQVWDATV